MVGGESYGNSCVTYLGLGMLGVKSTSSNLIEALKGLYSKGGLGKEEILLPWVEFYYFE